jgi:hypothetical protein
MLIIAACGRYCAAPRTTTPVWQAAIGRIRSLAHQVIGTQFHWDDPVAKGVHAVRAMIGTGESRARA